MSTLFPDAEFTNLDGEQCWRGWWSLPKRTSLRKLAKRFAEEGILSPKTGKAYNPMTVRYHAWKWAIDHQDEAYEILRFHWAKQGRIIDQEQWKKILVENARYVYTMTPKNFDKFIARYNLQAYL